jgi:aminoglycoside phosphotransferase (APT) family kinase protein
LRRTHDAQAGFPRPAGWEQGEVIAHNDLFWTNVILRDGLPAALIDWELAGPSTRRLEVAKAATYWAGLRIDEQLVEWGLSLERRGERLRLLCDSYGLSAADRDGMLDELVAWRRARLAQGNWRGRVPLEIREGNLRWIEEHAPELGTFLS